MAAHYLEVDWNGLRSDLAQECTRVREALEQAEAVYQQLLVVRDGDADQAFADRLFGTTATAAQVAMVADAVSAGAALHQLYEAASNVAVAQSNRLAELRKFIT